MIISIAGRPGAGKSTVGQLLSEHLNIPRYSMGDLFGKLAQEKGLNVHELGESALGDSLSDNEVDEYQRRLGLSGESFIADGRMSWHFIPHSLKVFLDVDPDIAAARMFADAQTGSRDDEGTYESLEEVKERSKTRSEFNRKRYLKHYGQDYLDLKNYDLVIDTSEISPEEVVQRILKAVSGLDT